ncbi:MAG TPA: hypothetical protein VHR66_01710 [Gemmataceae bacterium]|jgi:hypothetical protein|nr:hypothetical protein [Gemmataceae bacterium]
MPRTLLVGLTLLIAAMPAAAQAQWSTVKGKVVFDDSKNKIPVRVFPPAAKAAVLPPCAALDKDFLTEDWIVDPKTKAVKDAVVWLAPEPTADEWRRLKLPNSDKEKLREFPKFKPAEVHPGLLKVPANKVEIDQPCCRFIPHQSAMRVGQTLVIKNSAAFSHNAKYDTSNNGSENPLIIAGGKVEIPIKEPERSEIKIVCNIHGWMSASVRVFEHPYFAVTNEKGEYEIKDAPVGKYRIFVWHSTGGFGIGSEGKFFGNALTITPKSTDVKDYAVAPEPAK